VDYISRYGFYEGKGTSYRLDPRDIIKMFYPDKSPKEPTAAVNAVPADLELAPVSPDGQSSGSATLQSRPQGKGIFTDTLKAVFQWLADGGQGEFVLSDRNTLTVEKRSVLRGGNFTDFNGQAQGTMVFSLRNTSGQTTNVNFEELSREIGEEKWSKATVAFFSDAAMNGGIDIKDISVIRKADGQEIKFDERAVREVLQNGFNGFTPVIINITPVASPLLILGVAMPETAPALSSVPAQEISAGRELEPAVI
jgi:hypothetical protein